jgi:hypothetical protein
MVRLTHLPQDQHFEWRLQLDEVRNGMGEKSPVGRPRATFFLTEEEMEHMVREYCKANDLLLATTVEFIGKWDVEHD